MKKKYDIESFASDVETTLRTKLNAKIDAINTEKGDFLINNINDDAYVFGTLDDKVNNFNEFVFYYIDDIAAEGTGPDTSENIFIDVVVILNTAADPNTAKKLLRYQRALKELFNDEFNSLKFNIKVKVESLVPIQFLMQNSSNYSDCIGIKISTSIF